MAQYQPSPNLQGPVGPTPRAAANNPFLDARVPTFADVLARIREDGALTQSRRADLASALRTLARLLGQDVEAMAAMPGIYRTRVARLTPIETGLSAKRLANLRSDLMFALRRYGVVAGKRNALVALDEPWRCIWEQLELYQRCQLSRFVRWCSGQGIAPAGVDDEVITRFLCDLERESLVRNPRERVQAICRVWNNATAMRSACGLPMLTVPKFRQTYLVPLEMLPASFQADLDAFCRHLGGADPLAESGPPRPLRPVSVFRRRFQILQLLSGMVARGRDPQTILSLADVVHPDALRQALLFHLERAGNRTTTQISELANVALMVAKHWVRADAATIAAIKALRAKVAMRIRGMTETNAARLRQFDDPENLGRILFYAAHVFSELRRRPVDHRACIEARCALAVAILLAAPIRLGNLAGLRIGVHLVQGRAADGSVWHLAIPADQTKNSRLLEFQLPPDVVALLQEYRQRYGPHVAPPDTGFLFASPTGAALALNTFGQQISERIRQRTGLEMNPHLFRHLAAKLVLEATPGAYGIAQDILGHKDPMTTRNAYTGTEIAASVRHFEQVVQRKRATLQSAGPTS